MHNASAAPPVNSEANPANARTPSGYISNRSIHQTGTASAPARSATSATTS